MSSGNCWVYIFGERQGRDMKIGKTSERYARKRLEQVNREQTTDESYVCLAAVVGTPADEAAVKRAFEAHRRVDKGRRTEYFKPAPELVGYAAWLRSQWWASPDGEDDVRSWPRIDSSVWNPNGPSRRMAAPEPDLERMVQEFEVLDGPLANTPWSWFPNPKASIQDYFTPKELVDAVREGQGGIDLDAASHWLANRVHRIPRYFSVGYSAFEHEWGGKVWLNPPYGDNGPWWERVIDEVESGRVEQISILSPIWAFTTAQARPLMRLVDAAVILAPTPKFWGNADNKSGSNHPHVVVYIGNRVDAWLEALAPFGIPVEIAWDRVRQLADVA